MTNIKIIDQINENKFIIEIVEPRDPIPHVGVAHDYVSLKGTTLIGCKDLSKSIIIDGKEVQYLKINNQIQIPIRIAYKTLLPYLNNHEYLQEGHFTRYRKEDNLEKNYKKGDPYPAYAFYPQYLKFWDNTQKEFLVSYLRKDMVEPKITDLGDFFNNILPNIHIKEEDLPKENKFLIDEFLDPHSRGLRTLNEDYKQSWDNLIPVVKKIYSLTTKDNFDSNNILFDKVKFNHIELIKEGLYEAIIEYIVEWNKFNDN